MGLDHHLQAERYVDGGWPWIREEDPEKAAQYDAIMSALGLTLEDVAMGGIFVKMRLITWRKVNSIHGWVIDHCWAPDKEDNCVDIPMSREDVAALRNACRTAAALYRAGDLTDAALVAPPMQGFFFGGYELDDYWAQDLEEADRDLTRVLESPKFASDDWSFSYFAWY